VGDVECAMGKTAMLPAPVNLDFLEAIMEYMTEHDLVMPRNAEEALLLYVEIVHYFESDL